jgi:sulfur carrier protein ThiS
MLVSKIKPCKCEYKSYDETAKCLLKQLEFTQSTNYMDTNGNSVDNTRWETYKVKTLMKALSTGQVKLMLYKITIVTI